MLVLGRLTAEGVVKCQFGASQVTRETKALLSLGDDLKAASNPTSRSAPRSSGSGSTSRPSGRFCRRRGARSGRRTWLASGLRRRSAGPATGRRRATHDRRRDAGAQRIVEHRQETQFSGL